ncbi:MAG: hypothetical protein ABI068_07215 [Ktedonobacterales bacterium]
MSTLRILYWLLVGALFGVGFIAILSIGIFLLAAGLVLLIIGVIRLRGREWWAALVGFGAFPALILLWDVTSAPWACDAAGGVVQSGASTGGAPQTSVNYYTCYGPLTSYHILAIGFGVIALLGILYPLLYALFTSRHSPRVA